MQKNATPQNGSGSWTRPNRTAQLRPHERQRECTWRPWCCEWGLTKLEEGGKTLIPAAHTRSITLCRRTPNPDTATGQAEVHGKKSKALTGWKRPVVFEARRCSDPNSKSPAKTLGIKIVPQTAHTRLSASIHKVDNLQTGTTHGHGAPGAWWWALLGHERRA